MIALINARLVPVWIDIRSDPVPPLPEGTLPARVKLDEHRMVTNPHQEDFFLRSLVLSPNGKVLLNPQLDTPEATRTSLRVRGYFSYSQVKAADYLPMLEAAIADPSP